MSSMATIDNSGLKAHDTLYTEDVSHGRPKEESKDNVVADSSLTDADWETAKTRHTNNESKPEPGCRQILFKKMKHRLSCEPIDSTARAEIFVHQEPCIFCRMLASRAAQNLIQKNNTITKPISLCMRGRRRRLQNGESRRSGGEQKAAYSILSENNVMVKHVITPYLSPSERTVLFEVLEFCDSFNLRDHFCPKHGNMYKVDEEIYKFPPRRKGNKKGSKKNNSDKKSQYIMLGKILDKIRRDGKDPVLFRNKLDLRSRPFPPHMSDDLSINMPEIPLAEDPVFGKYFRRMKKCIKCEKEATARQHSKKGIAKCQLCNRYHHFSKGKSCSECHQFLGCSKCPGMENNPHRCGQCKNEFCSHCRNLVSCGHCGKSSCDKCIETAKFEFVTCSVCSYSYCTDCDATYFCDVCGELLCYYCRDGGLLSCKCGAILCCTKCKPQRRCDICGERKCLECDDMKANMNCSLCGGSSCKSCSGDYKCVNSDTWY